MTAPIDPAATYGATWCSATRLRACRSQSAPSAMREHNGTPSALTSTTPQPWMLKISSGVSSNLPSRGSLC